MQASADMWIGVLCDEYPGLVWDEDADTEADDYVPPDEEFADRLYDLGLEPIYQGEEIAGVGKNIVTVWWGNPQKIDNGFLESALDVAKASAEALLIKLEELGFDTSTFGIYLSADYS